MLLMRIGGPMTEAELHIGLIGAQDEIGTSVAAGGSAPATFCAKHCVGLIKLRGNRHPRICGPTAFSLASATEKIQ
jgi:hypothetical protein